MSELELLYKLPRQKSTINALAWSPDGTMLAVACPSAGTIQIWNMQTRQPMTLIEDHTIPSCPIWTPDSKMLVTTNSDGKINYWDIQTGQCQQSPTEHDQWAICLACSTLDKIVASGSADGTVRLWDVQTGQHQQTLSGHQKPVCCVAWSADGTMLASGSADKNIKLWTRNKLSRDWQLNKTLIGHFEIVTSLAWLPEKYQLISGSEDKTIRLWNTDTGQEVRRLEGHTAAITALSPSYDGELFASQADDIRIWSTDTWKPLIIPLSVWRPSRMPLPESALNIVAFHPHTATLALLEERNTVVTVQNTERIRTSSLAQSNSIETRSGYYTNAKIVLVGDTGIGKTALGYALMRLGFQPTDSTHNRTIWSFYQDSVTYKDGTPWLREIFLWDLAGQTSYRLIHQLHLNDVAVALVLFDARSETDPFAGVGYWRRALRQAESVQNAAKLCMKKFLVSARIDRGGPMVSRDRIRAFISSLDIDKRSSNFDAYYETSAKENRGIAQLAEAIKVAIDWDQLLHVTSPDLFQRIKAFLLKEKKGGGDHLLSLPKDLHREFLVHNQDIEQPKDLYAQFQACIQLLEAQGLIRRLNFGSLVLLQPELLDSYAAALIHAVREEPDGLGHILEDDVKACKFFIPQGVRILNEDEESLLVIAMIEDLVSRDIALRETSNDGTFLVFPAQSTRDYPNMPDPAGKEVIFSFEGPILNIYATLAVRLSHSGLFKKVGQWKNAITYTTNTQVPIGEYGIMLNNFEDGRAELALFFDNNAREDMRFNFEQYIKNRLERGVAPNPLYRRRIFQCSKCKEVLPENWVKARRERNFRWLSCPVCDERVSLDDGEELLTSTPMSCVSEMDSKADQNRDRSAAAVTLEGKIATRDFDVFLCYDKTDREEVEQLRKQLRDQGILPWFDMYDVQPGLPLQEVVSQQIQDIKSAAVFVGKEGVRPWQELQVQTLLKKFTLKGCPVIPVILPNAPQVPEMPLFLDNFSWVDFRKTSPNPMSRLIWGITGRRPENDYEVK